MKEEDKIASLSNKILAHTAMKKYGSLNWLWTQNYVDWSVQSLKKKQGMPVAGVTLLQANK